MQKITTILNDGLSYREAITYMVIQEHPLRTAKDLAVIIGCSYPRLSEALNTLLDKKLILKTKDYPVRYINND